MKKSSFLKKKSVLFKSYPLIALILALILTLVSRKSPEEQAYKIMVSSRNTQNSSLKIFGNVLLRLKNNYLDSSRLKPDKMFSAAIFALEKNIPELIVEKQKNILNITIEKKQKKYQLTKIKSFFDLYKNIQSFFALISHTISKNKLINLEYTAINGMLSTLDPHTMLLTPEIYREIKTGTQGFFSGIGIVVTYENDNLVVISPIDDTPAARVGIKTGDKIVKINNQLTSGISLNQAVNMLRGNPGTEVTIWIERKHIPHLLKFDLIRSTIRLNSVTSKILHGNIGYIRIKQFTQTTSSELSKTIISMKKKHIKGIILDMYNNPGGLLKEAGNTADLFLNKGIIFSIVTKNNKIELVRKADPSETVWNGSLVVLINGGSASASEILAGALKHNNRALIIGQKSFGKGSIQEISENDNGSALKMTIAHYLSAGKYVIQSYGVQPQISAFYVDINQQYHSFNWLTIQNKEKQKAIPLNIGQKDEPPFFKITLFEDEQNNENEEQYSNKASNELIEFTYNLLNKLKIKSTLDPQKHKNQIINWLKKQANKEMRRFIETLGNKGIDWSLCNSHDGSAILEYKVSFEKNIVMASDTLKGKLEIKNLGTNPLSRVRALINNKPNSNIKDILFGKINPGDKITKSFTYKIPVNTLDSVWPFTIQVVSDDSDKKHFKIIKTKIPLIKIKALPKPVFYVNYHMMDNIGGNGDGLCQKNEKIQFKIMVTNSGKGNAQNVSLHISLLDSKYSEILRKHSNIGMLKVNETASKDIFLTIPPKYKSKDLILLLTVEDQTYKIKVSKLLSYPIAQKELSIINSEGLFKIKNPSYIFDTPLQNMPPIGISDKNSIFKIISRFGSWIKIKINSERTAFIKRTSGIPVSPEKYFPNPIWNPIYQIIPPKIHIKQKIPLITKNCLLNINFEVYNPLNLKDIYAELITKNNYKKLFYIRSNKKYLKNIKQQIKLQPNTLNLIIIHARATKYLKTEYKQIIYCISSSN